MNHLPLKLLAAIVIFGFGCSGASDQVITGRVANGFPSTVTSVRVVHQGTVIASDQVAADGSFRLAFPPGNGLSLQLVGAGKNQLVFPRQAGTTARTFSARAGSAPFDLGQVRYVVDIGSTPVVFHNGPSSSTECEDGHDANGTTCIDDEDDNDDGTCEQEGEHEDDNEAEGGADDTDDGLAHEGDAVAEHNVPADGCNDDDDGEEDDDGGADD